MQRLRIPQTFKTGFEAIASLDTNSIASFVEELNKIPVGTSTEVIISSLANSTNKFELIIKTLDSLLMLISNNDKPLNDLIDDLVIAYQEIKPEIEQTEADRLKTNLKILLTKLENSKISFKAKDLLSEYENLYLESRILSDIRMIFNENLSEQNQYAVITHQLRLRYQKVDKLKEFFVTLDESDLIKLKYNIDRALEKNKLITEQSFNSLSFITFDK